MGKIEAREAEVWKLAGLVDAGALRRMEGMLVRMADQAAFSARKMEEEKRVELLRWPSVVPY